MADGPVQGLALLARADTEVSEVIFDDLRCTAAFLHGLNLYDIIDEYSHTKLDNFIQETQDKGAALLWELNVKSNTGPQAMQFFAIKRNGHMLIIASTSSQNIFKLYDELISIINEQSQLVRNLHKEKDELIQEPRNVKIEDGDAGILHEFMQMNNELINIQRELTRTNRQLERQEARFRKLINQNIDGLLVVDQNQVIRFANPRAETMLGLDRSELIGHCFVYFLSDETVHEIDIPYPNETRTLEIRSTPIDWEDVPAFLVSLRDITSQKQAEKLREDVERITKHDLKTPLNAVISLPDLIRMNASLGDEEAEYLTYIQEAGYRMLHMINRSLDLYKMEQGTYHVQPQAVDLIHILNRILTDTRSMRQTKEIQVDLLIHGRPATSKDQFWIQAEELLCHTMLENLVVNALEAAPAHTRVRIELMANELHSIAIHNQGSVPAQIRAAFFDKYTTQGKTQGTGLGTYSARLIAETQGGSIAMHSSEEDGTTIIVHMPKRGKGDSYMAHHILIAEDDATNQLIIKRILEKSGHTVTAAENGVQVLKLLEGDHFDLIVMDVQMPQMDGVEATRRIRSSSSRYQDIPIIALTAYAMAGDREKFLQAGMNAYIAKPVDREELIRVIEQALQGE